MWRRYLRLTGPNPPADVDDEVAFHVDQRAADLMRDGLSPDAARSEAERRFGDRTRYVEECVAIDRSRARETRVLAWLDACLRDTRIGLRQLRRSPWFTTGAVTTLALGIGATLAMYGLVEAVVLRPLPGVEQADRLIEVARTSFSNPGLRDLRAAVPNVVQLAGFSVRPTAVRMGDESMRLTGHVVTGNYFGVLGARATLGRLLVESDDAATAPRVVVISHALWARRFNRDSAIVGRTLLVNQAPATIVGVAEAGFRGTRINATPGLWLTVYGWWAAPPSYFARLNIEERGWGWLTAIGRLRPGETPLSAKAALDRASIGLRDQLALGAKESLDTNVLPAVAASGGPGGSMTRTFIWVLFGTVALVLLLAWVNVAGLLIARGLQREREIGVRLAIGAGRARLVRQLLTETAVLAAIAGAASLAAAHLGARLLAAIEIPGWGSLGQISLGIGGGSAAFAVVAALATSLIFGFTPALRATRRDVVAAITHGGFRAPRAALLRDALVVTQVALTVVLLIGAALFARGLQSALSIEPGFDDSRVAMAIVDLGLAKYDSNQARRYLDGAAQRIAALPGVRSVAWADVPPLYEGSSVESFHVLGAARDSERTQYVELSTVTPHYFDVLRIPVRAGRVFSEPDHSARTRVIVVNETFARRHGGVPQILGRQVVLDDTMTVIGVVADVKYHTLTEEARPFVYAPMARAVATAALWPVGLLVRTERDDRAMMTRIERALRAEGRNVAPFGQLWLSEHVEQALLPQRLSLFLLGTCSLLALVIALVGMYSLATFFVVTRRRELALRIALGARPESVVRRVLAHGLRRVGIGVLVGAAAVVAAMRAAQALLYGVHAADPTALAAGAGVVLVAMIVAILFPARAASRMDAMRNLRQE